MNTLYLNTLAGSLICAVILLGGYIPFWLSRINRAKFLFAIANSLARGIFFAVGFIHLLPEASHALHNTLGSLSFAVASAVCAAAIILLLFLEQSLSDYFKEKEKSKNVPWLPYLLAIMLSTHSVLAGAALGLEHSFSSFIAIFVAIVIHKGSEAFALSISMQNHHIKKQVKYRILFLFSLMTPLGILFGASLSSVLDSHSGQLSAGIFNAIAAGTFIYIAMLDKLNSCNHCITIEKISNVANLCAISLGFSMIASISLVMH